MPRHDEEGKKLNLAVRQLPEPLLLLFGQPEKLLRKQLASFPGPGYLGSRSFQRLLSINAIARLIKLQKKRQMTENEEIVVKMINLLNCVSLCHQGTTRRGDSARRRRPGWRSQQATSPVPRPASSFSLNSSSCIL